MLQALKGATLKTLISTSVYFNKKNMYYIITTAVLESFHIIRHSYTASLSIKTRFYETNIFFPVLNRFRQKH